MEGDHREKGYQITWKLGMFAGFRSLNRKFELKWTPIHILKYSSYCHTRIDVDLLCMPHLRWSFSKRGFCGKNWYLTKPISHLKIRFIPLFLFSLSIYIYKWKTPVGIFFCWSFLKMCSKFIGEHLWWTAAFGTSFLAYLILSLTLLKKLMKKLKRPYLLGWFQIHK